MYKLVLHPKIKKALTRFPKADQARIAEKIRSLALNPRPHGCVHLKDVLFRIRVGEYRVIYGLYEDRLVVIVVEIARRSERSYQDLERLIAKANRLFGE